MRKIVFVALTLFAVSGLCSATFIRMGVEMTTPVLITNDSFELNVTVTNSGDEPAHDVQLSLIMPDGFAAEDVYVGTLTPNKPFRGHFDVNTTTATPGRYPVILKTHYSDANAYPFSTVSPKFIDYLEHAKTTARGKISEVELSGEESEDLTVTIVNLESTPKKYRVKLHTPNEIKAEPLEQEVQVPATSEEDATFSVKSFGALPDSSYVVVASIENTDESGGRTLQHSTIASGIVKIVKAQTTEYVPNWLPIAILVFLVIVFLVFQLRKRGSDAPGKEEDAETKGTKKQRSIREI